MSNRWTIRRADWVTVALLALVAVHALRFKGGEDFGVFHTAAVRAIAGEELYRASDGLMPFKYAPAVSLLLSPLGVLPPLAARAVWSLITIAALVVLLRWSADRFDPQESIGARVFSLALLSPFILHLFALGQADAILLALMVLSERLRARPIASGALWAIAVLFKPPFLVFLAGAVAFAQWRRVASLVAWILVGLALPALRYGPGGAVALLVHWRALLAGSTPERLCEPHNQSLFAMVCSVSAPQTHAYLPVVLVAASAIVAVEAVAVFRLRRANREAAQDLAAALQMHLSALLSPLGWRTNLLGTAPALSILDRARRVRPLQWVVWIATLAMTVAAVLRYEVMGPDGFRTLLAWRMYGFTCLLAALTAAFTAARSRT